MTDSNIFINKKAAYYTLGCKLNFAETSTIGKLLWERGVRKALPGEKADICVINTCSVTEFADKKCRQAIRKIKRENPDSYVVVTGCYAQLKPEEVSSIKGVDLILGADKKREVAKYILESGLQRGTKRIAVSKINEVRIFSPSCSQDDRTRHFLKVQDGCDYYCSYCTIPFARGRSRNGSIDSLVRQAEEAGAQGAKEIVITGVNIGDFGKTTGESFYDLLKSLEKVEKIERYRISSIEPDLLSDEIIEFVSVSDKFMPHFHIPLQSGSDAVLKMMRRKYDTGLFASKITRIKSLMPDCFIGVDVIVGLRGETEEYFKESESFINSLDISQLHVFTYSERPGTKALSFTPVVSPEEKHERSRLLLDISMKKKHDFYQCQIGTNHKVLFEHARKGGKMFGFTENYIKVETPYDESLANKIVRVKLSGFNSMEEELKAVLL